MDMPPVPQLKLSDMEMVDVMASRLIEVEAPADPAPPTRRVEPSTALSMSSCIMMASSPSRWPGRSHRYLA
jgi:hypothetical protein